jgi:hypothetical protein
VLITRFGGPAVFDVVDVPEPTAGDGQPPYDMSTAGISDADTQPYSQRGSGESGHCPPKRKHRRGSRCSPVVLHTEGQT